MNRFMNVLDFSCSNTPKKGYSQDYALTVTLKPFLYKEQSEIQYYRTYRQLIDLFTMAKCRITLVAELTNTYNIHYHGILSIPLKADSRKWIFDRLRLLSWIGKCTVDSVDDYDGWLDYLSKDQLQMVDYPCMVNDYDIDFVKRKDNHRNNTP